MIGNMPVNLPFLLTTKTLCISSTSVEIDFTLLMASLTVEVSLIETNSVCMIPPAESSGYSRSFFTSIDSSAGIELRTFFASSFGRSAIKSAASSDSISSTIEINFLSSTSSMIKNLDFSSNSSRTSEANSGERQEKIIFFLFSSSLFIISATSAGKRVEKSFNTDFRFSEPGCCKISRSLSFSGFIIKKIASYFLKVFSERNPCSFAAGLVSELKMKPYSALISIIHGFTLRVTF